MGVEVDVNAIPTQYNGVNFRSRLEAKWAAFFDILEIGWTYEPFDRNGWIPDFQIGLSSTIVEVRPNQLLTEADNLNLWKAAQNGFNAIWLDAEFEFLSESQGFAIGTGYAPPTPLNSPTQVDITTDGVVSLLWTDWATRSDHRVHIAASPRLMREHSNPLILWREAGNLTQWNAPKKFHQVQYAR